jgi:hypothetical protein
MLDYIAAAERWHDPYAWALVQDLIAASERAVLRTQVPDLTVLNRSGRRSGGDMSYGMYVLPLVDHGRRPPVLDALHPVWRELVDVSAAQNTALG